MQRLNDGHSFLLAGVVGSWGDQWKGVMEMSQVGPFAPQQRAQSANAIGGPERSGRQLDLARYSIFRDFSVVLFVFQNLVTGGPQQLTLSEKNFVFPA